VDGKIICIEPHANQGGKSKENTVVYRISITCIQYNCFFIDLKKISKINVLRDANLLWELFLLNMFYYFPLF
jgi:hypothetical protein